MPPPLAPIVFTRTFVQQRTNDFERSSVMLNCRVISSQIEQTYNYYYYVQVHAVQWLALCTDTILQLFYEGILKKHFENCLWTVPL